MKLPAPLGRPRRAWFGQLCLLAAVEIGALLSLAIAVRHVFDAVLTGGLAAVGRMGVAWLAVGIVLVLISAVARGLQRPIGEKFAQHYARRVRSRVLKRWFQQLASAGDAGGRGTLLLRLMGDASALSRWHGRVMARSIANLTALAAVTLALVAIAWPLAIAAIGPLLLGLLGQWWAGQRLESSTGHARRQRSRLAATVAQVLDTAASPSRTDVLESVKQLDHRGRRLGVGMVGAAQHSGWIEAFGYAMTGGALVATLAVGTWLAASGEVTPGTVLLAALWVGHFSRPVHELARAQDAWRRARVSRRKLERLLSGPGAGGRADPDIAARAPQMSIGAERES